MMKKFSLVLFIVLLLSFTFVLAYQTYYPTESELNEGYLRNYSMYYKSALINFEGEKITFFLHLNDVDFGIFRVYTDSKNYVEKELKKGDTWKLDLNNNGYYDLQIDIEDIQGYYYLINLKKINQKIFTENVINTSDIKEKIVEQIDLTEDLIEEKSSINFVIISAVILLIFFGILFFVFKKPKDVQNLKEVKKTKKSKKAKK